MKHVVFLCDGHGSETPGKRTPYISEIGRQIKENEFNSAVTKGMKARLESLGVIVIEVAPTNADTSLITRTNLANKQFKELQAKYGKGNVKAVYVSVHYDAFDSKFDGYDPEGLTVFVQTGNLSKESGKLARAVNKYLAMGTKQKNRGVKEGNYHVLRETLMPAILTENGFMDNKREALLMIDPKFQAEVTEEHVKGICEYFNIPYEEVKISKPVVLNTPKPSTSSEKEYKVKIKVSTLNYRSGAGVTYPVKGAVKENQVFTITATKNGWGKLKSGAGWINVSSAYVTKL